MITEEDLKEAIAECHGTRNPNASTCIKLASYYAILDHMKEEPTYSYASEPTGQVRYDSGSAFSDAIRGKDIHHVLSVIDELMETLQILSPKLYDATMDEL